MNTEQAHGHWPDRFTKDELIAAVIEIGTRRNPTLMKDVAYVLGGGSVAIDAGTLSDEVAGYAHQIALRTGAYDDAAILGDVADCLQEIEEEYAADMNLPLPPRFTTSQARNIIREWKYVGIQVLIRGALRAQAQTGCRNPTDSGERCGFCAYCLTASATIAEDRKHASEQDQQYRSETISSFEPTELHPVRYTDPDEE